MAKIITPPQIQDLSELLDVLVHPDKYIKYMQDMAAMRDAIAEQLGALKTRDEANELMAASQRKYAEAEEVVEAAEEQAKTIAATLEERRKAVLQQEEACAQEKAAAQKQNQEDRAVLAAQQREMDIAAKDQATREAFLRNWEESLRARGAVLDQKETKLNKLKQAMGEAGI